MHIKIFFPVDETNAKSGFLFGQYCSSKNCYYILVVSPDQNYANSYPKTSASLSGIENLMILGQWFNNKENVKQDLLTSYLNFHEQWLVLKSSDQQVSAIVMKLQQSNTSVDSENGVIILFNFASLFDSKTLLPEMKEFLPTQSNQAKLPLSALKEYGYTCDPLCQIIDLSMVFLLYSKVLNNCQIKRKHSWSSETIFSQFYCKFWNQLLFLLHLFSLKALKTCEFFDKPVNFKYIEFSSIGTHVYLKLKLLFKLCSNEAPFQSRMEILTALFFDFVLGLLFWSWLSSNSFLWFHTSKTLMPSLDYTAKQVEGLIRWLMGVPIGLKLNSPLNQFLGKFFLHHVHLWLEYIEIMLNAITRENAQGFTWIFYINFFGISFSLAFLSDVVSLLTFHLYCFYVYATRLYGIQIAGLASFWRLFRGKKWNPLRMRVDTLPHSPDVANHRFYTGTLLFTMLLFLLPTTAFYYAIFALLRVATLCVQKFLRTFTVYVACFPWLSLFLRFVNPLRFASHARFLQSKVLRPEEFTCQFKDNFKSNNNRCFIQLFAVLDMDFVVRSYRSVVYSGLKKPTQVALLEPIKFRHIIGSVISGKLLK